MSENKTAIQKTEVSIVDEVLSKIEQFEQTGELVLPQDYSAQNAMKAAMLILNDLVDKDNKPVLTSCSRASIANSLLKMVVLGLNPLKKQCAFIAYSGSLSCSVEYFGNIALAKRYGNLEDIHANVIYVGDVFEYSVDANTGAKKLVKHEQSIDNIDIDKIKGAYAIKVFTDGKTDMEVMTFKEIKAAWAQSKMGETPAHKKFPQEMSKKTVINRACKIIIDSSNDSAIISNSAPLDEGDTMAENSKAATRDNANQETIDTPVTVMESTQPEVKEQPAEQATEQKPLF